MLSLMTISKGFSRTYLLTRKDVLGFFLSCCNLTKEYLCLTDQKDVAWSKSSVVFLGEEHLPFVVSPEIRENNFQHC